MSENSRGSVSLALAGLKAGDERALAPLWERYFLRLAALGRARLGAARAADGEDVASEALHSLCRGVSAGRFPRLEDRDDLWRVLACIAARKAAEARRSEGRLKRGGAAVERDEDLAGLLSREPSPEDEAMLSDLLARLLAALHDDSLRRVALLKMEGLTNEEVAGRIQCVPRTVERKLALVRSAWNAAK